MNKENETTNNSKPMAYDTLLGVVISDELIEKTAWEYGEAQVGNAFNKYQSDQSFKAGVRWIIEGLNPNNA